MSLQLAAQHLAAQGRGPDKQLVHMSPREVAGLQALAMAHGGSLTINPDTGLPEAGFLDNLLPAVIGAGLMFATGGAAAGALTPGMIGLGVGALQTARTGSLEKGLMAGLGAYGGAGMFAGLAGAGAAGAGAVPQAAGAGAGAVPQAAGVTPGMGLADTAVGPQFSPDVLGLDEALTTPSRLYANPFTGQPNLADYAYGPEIQSNLLDQQARNQSLADLSERFSDLRIDPLTESQNARLSSMRALGGPEAINAAYGQYPPPLTVSAPVSDTAISAAAPKPAIVENLGMGEPGYTKADMDAYRSSLRQPTVAERFGAMPTKDKFKYGLAALSPALLAQPKYKAPVLDNERYIYSYDPGYKGMPPQGYAGEYPYFQPKYTRVAAEGGLMGRARRAITGGDDNQGDDRQRYTYDPVKQQYAKVALPPAVVAEALDQIKAIDVGSGGFDGQVGGPGLAGLSAAALGETFGDAALGAAQNADAMQSMSDALAADAAAANSGGGGTVAGGWGADGGDGLLAKGGLATLARGGISDLGDYSDGGRLLKGPGDGVSDSIPAMIGPKQPARLADGEFVIPARIVSELGNGSTDAGARKLYAMMDRIQKARGKTVGKGKVAKNSRAEKYLPA